MADTKLTDNGFFWTRDGVLSPEFCEGIIAKFEACPDKKGGVTVQGYRPDSKISTDLFLSGHPDFAEEDKVLCDSVSAHINDYLTQINRHPWSPPFTDTGYNLQRTLPGEHFDWHSDFHVNALNQTVRAFTFIWYLNDVPSPGGYTEFCNGVKVTPEQGRLLFFPADFANMHRGVSPNSPKYIITGWIYQRLDPSWSLPTFQPQ
jgi:hypothetical protein